MIIIVTLIAILKTLCHVWITLQQRFLVLKTKHSLHPMQPIVVLAVKRYWAMKAASLSSMTASSICCVKPMLEN